MFVVEGLAVIGQGSVSVQHAWAIEFLADPLVLFELNIILFLSLFGRLEQGFVDAGLLHSFFLAHPTPRCLQFLHHFLINIFVVVITFLLNCSLQFQLMPGLFHHLYQFFSLQAIVVYLKRLLAALLYHCLDLLFGGLPIFVSLLPQTSEFLQALVAIKQIEYPVVGMICLEGTVNLPQEGQSSPTLLAHEEFRFGLMEPSGVASEIGGIDRLRGGLEGLFVEIAEIDVVLDVVQVYC